LLLDDSLYLYTFLHSVLSSEGTEGGGATEKAELKNDKPKTTEVGESHHAIGALFSDPELSNRPLLNTSVKSILCGVRYTPLCVICVSGP